MKQHTVLLSRAPLPMLALSAAYGVWHFQALFVPWYVAALSAVAFETVYVSLAFAPTRDRRRAVAISVAAVVVSVAYNTLSSLFTIRPALLAERALWADVALALLHGAPLAVVAYAVADLLLHSESATAPQVTAPARASAPPDSAPAERVTAHASGALSKSARVRALAAERGVSETTMWRMVKRGEVQV